VSFCQSERVQTLSSGEVKPNSYLTVTEPRTQLVAWGDEADLWNGVQFTNGIAISSNGVHTSGLNADGTVVVWNFRELPVGWNEVPVGLSNVVAIAEGDNFSLALRGDGTIVTWAQEPGLTVPLPPADLTNVIAISASFGGNCLALKTDGTVSAWGNETQPAPPGLSNVVAIATGPGYDLALTANGRVVDWLGTDWTSVKAPADLQDVVAVAAGGSYGLALKSDGTVVGWGIYTDPLGGGKPADPPAGLSNVVAIAAASYSLALKADGSIVEWAFGSETNDAVLVTNIDFGVKTVVAITAAPSNSLALVGDVDSVLHGLMTNPTLDAAGFGISVPSQSGRVYRLEYRAALENSSWHALPLVGGTGGPLRLTDPDPSDTTRFYRVRRW
jgi:hypothetical protein